MAVLEAIAIGVAVHLGKRVVDWIWDAVQDGGAPVADQSGNVGLTVSRAGRTVVDRGFTVPRAQPHAQVTGELYCPGTISESLYGDEVALMLIVEETEGQALLFAVDLDGEYELVLPHGLYSSYILLMDTEADDFLDAEIYAIGFPSAVDLSGIDQFTLEDPEHVWDMVSDAPWEVTWGGPYRLDFILIDTEEIQGFPRFLAELIEDDVQPAFYDLTGVWELEEDYDFGCTVAEMYLVQFGSALLGEVVIHDRMDDGTELIIEESLAGEIEGARVSLSGTSVRALRGRLGDYFLDRWEGVVEHEDRIAGYSQDEAGTSGVFVMERVS